VLMMWPSAKATPMERYWLISNSIVRLICISLRSSVSILHRSHMRRTCAAPLWRSAGASASGCAPYVHWRDATSPRRSRRSRSDCGRYGTANRCQRDVLWRLF
jgi:hypothetical protein